MKLNLIGTLIYSALAGLTISLIFAVWFPSIPICRMEYSKYWQTYWAAREHMIVDLKADPAPVDELENQAHWLRIARQEVLAWPFHLTALFLGPMIILARRKKKLAAQA